MDKELKQELDWINENLMAAVSNQEYLYLQIRDITNKLNDFTEQKKKQ